MDTLKIFVLEDDPWFGEVLTYHLALNPDHEVKRFETAKACLANLHEFPDVVTVDYRLPDSNGKDVLKAIKSQSPSTTVIIVSSQEDIGTAVELLREGAFDYVVKNDEANDRLWLNMIRIKEQKALRAEVETLREEVRSKFEIQTSILGNSPGIIKTLALIEKAAKSSINVSVTGETGTGKELVAKGIHYNSARAKHKMITVNVAAIPSDLMESELFGHEKGAFTGASFRRLGKFEEAHKGTIFLDEIAEMDLGMQVKLLRVLQEREIVRVGSNTTVPIDVRVICATHKHLEEEVKAGRFRQDLYFRLFGLPIHLPPLRERPEDIMLLAKSFMEEFAKANQSKPLQFSSEAKKKLLGYPFPGNVRELKAMVELACVLADSQEISAEDLHFQGMQMESQLLAEEKTLEEYEIDIVRHFLKKYDQDVYLVAQKLNVGKSTIYRMIKSHALKKG